MGRCRGQEAHQRAGLSELGFAQDASVHVIGRLYSESRVQGLLTRTITSRLGRLNFRGRGISLHVLGEHSYHGTKAFGNSFCILAPK